MIPPQTTTFIFDFDGVIVDSMQNNFRAWQKVFNELKVSFNSNEYFLLEGAPPKDIVKFFLKNYKTPLTPEFIQNITEKKETYYKEGEATKLYPDIKNYLDLLQRNKLKIGLVSGGAKARILSTLQNYNIENYFDVIISADDIKNGKPSPEPYLKCLEALQSTPQQSLVIENAPLGVKSAKSANIKVIAIGTTLGENYLSEADLYLENHQKLYDILEQLLLK